MDQTNTTTSQQPEAYTGRPLPPDQFSPKSVVLQLVKLKDVAKRNWKILVLTIILCGLIGYAYDYFNTDKPLYTSSILFNLGGGSSGGGFGGDLGALASAFGMGGGASDANIFSGDNFLVYAQSRPVVEKTLMHTDTIYGKPVLLANYYIENSGIRDKEWEDSDSLRAFRFDRAKKPIEYTKMEQSVMSQIYARIGTEISVSQPERKSSFMQIYCGMEDEQLTAHFLTTHLKTIEEDYRQKETKKTREMYDLTQNRADSLLRVMTGTENKLARYMDQNQQMVVAQGRMIENKLTRNSTFLSTLYYQTLQQVDAIRLSLIREAPLFTVIEPVSFPLTRTGVDPLGLRLGIALGVVLGILIIFLRETYRSIMREE